MITKKKKIIFIVSAIVIILIVWITYNLITPDVKGKINPIKKIYFKVTGILPVKPAIRLDVLFHRQERALSCEIASLMMALRYRGVEITENQLIEQMPISDAGHRTAENVWGDPNLGFVGNINGTMPNTGYGVYEQPLYDLALKYRDAKIIKDATLNDLLKELINGSPIVVWGVVGKG
ncbi:MAG: C39 family peptidase, partial [Candidatus Portnoybacteria bacterium]|nr:C39 family peptidase [Candidatus Portnoybacteria bacterium]